MCLKLKFLPLLGLLTIFSALFMGRIFNWEVLNLELNAQIFTKTLVTFKTCITPGRGGKECFIYRSRRATQA